MPVPLPSLRTVCLLASLVLGAGLAPIASAQSGSGLKWPEQAWGGGAYASDGSGATWRGRVGLGLSAGLRPSLTPDRLDVTLAAADANQMGSLRLLGDYYFSRNSGFRATGGLLRGSIGSPWMLTGTGTVAMGWSPQTGSGTGLRAASPDAGLATVPYVGAGYSFDLPQTWGGDWSFSADVGMVAVAPGVRLGTGYGSQYLDEAVREMRLRPVLQLGVSYSF